jgi:hypothetical protein
MIKIFLMIKARIRFKGISSLSTKRRIISLIERKGIKSIIFKELLKIDKKESSLEFIKESNSEEMSQSDNCLTEIGICYSFLIIKL